MPATTHDPSDYARSHWRRFETDSEHAERVERAEQTALLGFQRATVRQKSIHDLAMADLRGLSAPVYDRRRAGVTAEWHRSTEEARILFNRACDEIMRDGEESDETNAEWDALIAPDGKPAVGERAA